MKYQMVLTPTAVKDLRKLPPSVQKRLKTKLQFYLTQSEPLDFAVKLAGHRAGEYRFRAGNYRIVFDKVRNRLKVLYIEHRRDVYRRR